MGTSSMLEGKVAQILNEREVVINRGTKNGVTAGMRFAILAANPIEVRDPENDELLGTVDREKVKVEAIEVMDKLTVCATFEKTVIGGTSLVNILDSFGPRREIPRTLRTSSEDYPEPLSPEESYVKVGDRVKEIPSRKRE